MQESKTTPYPLPRDFKFEIDDPIDGHNSTVRVINREDGSFMFICGDSLEEALSKAVAQTNQGWPHD